MRSATGSEQRLEAIPSSTPPRTTYASIDSMEYMASMSTSSLSCTSSLSSWPSVRRVRSFVRGTWKRRSSEEHIQLMDEDRDGESSSSSTSSSSSPRRRQVMRRVVILLVVVGVALLVLSRLPVKEYLLNTSTWIRHHTVLGTVVAIVLFWLAIPLCVPSTIAEAVSGSLFGVAHGTAVIVIGKTGGSLLTFLIGRRVGHAVVGDYLATTFPTFRALAKVLGGSNWKPLILFQLSSIPNLVKCYGLAVTNVTGTRFACSAMVANVPHAIVWANIGSQASDIAAILSGQSELSRGKLTLLIGGAIFTVAAMTFLVVYTKRELHELQKLDAASSSEDDLDEEDEDAASVVTITIDQGPGLAMHSDENELIKVRSNTHG